MTDQETAGSVLNGTRVIDLTQALAGPYCTMLLGDLGADVIKVERPDSGDQSRGWGPPYLNGESAYFLSVNRNKRGITLNLKEPRAQKILHKLITTADVFVVNQPRLSSLKKLGVDYETLHQLNPGLVYCSITGYGMTGPYAGRPGYDVVIQGEAGLMSLTGEVDGDPVRYPIPIADVTTGIYSALAILAALLARERTGEGQFIDNSLIESQVAWLTNVGGNYFATGQRPSRLGNAHPSIVPYQPFKARDKHLIVGVGTERLWKRFCRALNVEDTLMTAPRFATNADRLVHRDELIPLLEEILSTQDADHWLERFREAGIPCGPINFVDEILNDPHIHERGVVVKLEHPAAGLVRSIANPMHLSETPVSYRLPPPTLGQHNQQVREELGIGPAAEKPESAHLTLQALSIGRPLLAALGESPFQGRVWRSSDAACHLVDTAGRAVSLVTGEVGNGPLNIVLEGDAHFGDLEEGWEARIDGDQLTVGERLTVSLQDATPWDATLKWHEINGEALAVLWKRAETQATSESLLTVWVPSVRPLRGARMALMENARNAAEQLLLALYLGDEARVSVYVRSLIGLGPGTTPAGDDFLLGLMAGLRAWPSFLATGGLTAEQICKIVVGEARDRTHAFSLARLQAARAHQMDAPWHHLADALTDGDEGAIKQAADVLLSSGATSGADALAGLLGPYLVSDLHQADV